MAEYVWQFNDRPGGAQNNTQESTSPTITHTFPAAGAYLVALTVMNADGTSYGTAHFITAGFSCANGRVHVGQRPRGRSDGVQRSGLDRSQRRREPDLRVEFR